MKRSFLMKIVTRTINRIYGKNRVDKANRANKLFQLWRTNILKKSLSRTIYVTIWQKHSEVIGKWLWTHHLILITASNQRRAMGKIVKYLLDPIAGCWYKTQGPTLWRSLLVPYQWHLKAPSRKVTLCRHLTIKRSLKWPYLSNRSISS